MTTHLSQEDKDFLDDLLALLRQAAITGGEVSIQAIANFVSNLPNSSVSQLNRMFKVYGYAGVFFALQDSLDQGTADPLYKYALSTIGFMAVIGTNVATYPVFLIALAIGGLVEGSWYLGEWIAENQDNLLNKLKELLQDAGINIDDEGNISGDLGSLVNICPMPSKDETMCLIKDAWYIGQSTRSPLVLDLDGDGVETISNNNGVYFDHDNNGFAENSGWVGADDGLLVRDINNNGSIDSGTELFGNNTVLSSGQNAQNGFDALADLDSNKDGVFNSSDTAWNEVKVWKDSNSDATVNEGELITLENANINAINLSYNEQDVTDDNDNQHLQTGTFNKTNETTGTISDVWFATDMANTIDKTEIEIPENIASLPNVQGFGQIYWR